MADRSRTLAELIPRLIGSDGRGGDALKVAVVSENVPPSNVLLSNNIVDDQSPAGTRIGVLTVVDANANDTHTITVTSDPDDKFDIENPSTSSSTVTYLRLKNPVDFPTSQTHNVTLRATDPTDLSVDVQFTITVVPDFTNTTSVSTDKVDESMNGGDIHQYDAGDAFTVAMWIKPGNLATRQCLFAKCTNDANVYGYALYVDATTGALFTQIRASGSLQSFTYTTSLITAGDWQHVVFTYAGGNNINGAKVYINSVIGSTPGSGGLNSWLAGQDFTVSARNTAFRYGGFMDEITVWDREFTQAEVAELYNSGVSDYDPNIHSQASNLQAWSNMEDDTAPTVTDKINSNDLTMINMDDGNFSTDIP